MKKYEVRVKFGSGGSVPEAGATGRSGNMTGKCKQVCICPAIYRSKHPDSSGFRATAYLLSNQIGVNRRPSAVEIVYLSDCIVD